MISVVLTMPDDPAALPVWLEQRLLSPDLPQLVAELTVLHGVVPRPTPLADLLGPDSDRVLDEGLTVLPRSQLSSLLRQPELLLELRDVVLTAGGSYWSLSGSGDDLVQRSNRVADRVRAAVANLPTTRPRTKTRWWTHTVTALATAAAVLFVVYLLGFRPPANNSPQQLPAANWGFARLKDLPPDAGDAVVLARLADLASEWSNVRPEGAAALAQRLGQFRQGCAALQLDDNLPLSAPQRQWLRLRCSDWAAAIDAHLRQLEETRDVASVQTAADETATRIAQELRERVPVPPRSAS